ncbi:MAG TPA: PhoPQ-activated protein PqaA family protein [Candidatus Deferrimicrobium sp.]|nr:PhoPQ-activated protein PqaA family protein [Candidatus Deferrimicrobium sp.]
MPAAIVLHPHPQFGGSMHNNVVDAVCEELENKMFALKFNCRGVGRSEGISSGGVEEGKDIEAAFSFLKMIEGVDQNRIAFIGYSWGTYAGFPVTYKNPEIKLLIGISCPVGLWNYNYLQDCTKPKLLTVGTSDSFAPVEKIKKLFEALKDPKELFMLDTDHFYMGQEKTLAVKISTFLEEYI